MNRKNFYRKAFGNSLRGRLLSIAESTVCLWLVEYGILYAFSYPIPVFHSHFRDYFIFWAIAGFLLLSSFAFHLDHSPIFSRFFKPSKKEIQDYKIDRAKRLTEMIRDSNSCIERKQQLIKKYESELAELRYM
jgi:hypothetical protein